MTPPCIVLRCDSCDEAAYLYRLYGTSDALCAPCFVAAHPPVDPGAATRRSGPAAAGCLRNLRSIPRSTGVHRVLGPAVRRG